MTCGRTFSIPSGLCQPSGSTSRLRLVRARCTFIAADAVPDIHAANVESISGEGA